MHFLKPSLSYFMEAVLLQGFGCDCDTNQSFPLNVSSMEILQTQPSALPTAAAEFLLWSVFTNAIRSGGAGRTHPDFILYLLGKLRLTAEAAAAQMGWLQKRWSCTSLLPAAHRDAESPGSASHEGLQYLWCIPKKSNLNHKATALWQKTTASLPPSWWAAGSCYLSRRRAEIVPLNSDQVSKCLPACWSWSEPFFLPSFSFSILRVANKYHNRI